MRYCLPVSCLLFTGALLAQGAVSPFQLLQTNPHPGLNPPAVPATSVVQVNMTHLPSDPANLFRCSMSTLGLLATNGGMGSYDLLTGSYDVTTDTFTPDMEAAGLNTAAGLEFGLMVHSSGLWAVFDRINEPPHLASRPAIGQPWVDVGPIPQVTTLTGADPALADYHGQTWLLYNLTSNGVAYIVMAPIDLNTATLTASPTAIIGPAFAGSSPNSASPILDAQGQLIGVSHHDVLSSDNDHYLSLDLDPNTPSVLMYDTTTWINNGGFIGGRFFDAENTAIFSMDTYWCPGGRAAVGGTMSIDFYTPPTSSLQVYLSALLVNMNFLPAPVVIPGLPGALGINPIGAKYIGFYLHNNVDGKASTSFTIPNNANLHNVKLAAQAAVLEAQNGTITLANTSALTIE